MFVLSVETCFWAWHQLKLPDGQTEPAHGHHWVVIADVSSDRLDTMGLVMDFRDLKAALDGIVAGFNNRQLDRLEPFSRNNPSAENVAKYIYEKLQARLGLDVRLDSVRVCEESGCWAKYLGGPNCGSDTGAF